MDTDKQDTKRKNRAFWQSVIDEAVFNFADQPPPRHGGNNWIRIPMPFPANWISAFRDNKGNAGFFMSLDGEYGMSAYFEIEKASSQLEIACGLDIRMEIKCRSPFASSISFDYDGDPSAEPMFREWLVKSSNRLINTLRPFLEQLGIEKDRKKSSSNAQSLGSGHTACTQLFAYPQ